MEVVPQVLDAFIGKVPVVMTPGELFSDIAARLQGLLPEMIVNSELNYYISYYIINYNNYIRY